MGKEEKKKEEEEEEGGGGGEGGGERKRGTGIACLHVPLDALRRKFPKKECGAPISLQISTDGTIFRTAS